MSSDSATRPSRRQFLGAGVSAPAILALPAVAKPAAVSPAAPAPATVDWKARWIWFPERRTLPCTFVFFRKEFELAQAPAKATGWVSGNSRYMLYINGRFVQRGPAPCDPRYWDADPVDLAPHLRPGRNVIGGLVCSFGGGDGTYVPGTPVGNPACAGFLFQAEIPTAGGALELSTGDSWQSHRARSWPAGNYQRWYLRALQEEFDAREYPYGWNEAGFDASGWRPAAVRDIPPGRPLLTELSPEGFHDDWRIEPRTIPLMTERVVHPVKLTASGWVDWHVPAGEYFDCFPPDAFAEQETPSVVLNRSSAGPFPLRLAAPGNRSAVVTFDFEGEVAGYPFVRLRAPAGTVVEMLFLESQEPGRLLLRTNPNYGQWIRVTAREGETYYEAFDWDVLRHLQLAVRGCEAPVEILECGVTQRLYPYPQQPDVTTSDEAINRAIRGAITTHLITSQDTLMDNITRERQQYAGDVDHAKLVSYCAFGEYRQPRRMIETFAQGQNDEGWFMDSWPAWDRCARLWQKSLKLTKWGPILDHGLGFVISAANYYLYSGDKTAIESLYPRFLRFDRFLASNVGRDGLLPVTEWVRNSVWIDHRGFLAEIDKQASLNIYYIGFLLEGIARMADWLGDSKQAALARRRASEVAETVRKHFWSAEHGLFVDNLPRVRNDGELRLHERTLAMALLYGLCPPGQERAAVNVLADLPTGSNGPVFVLKTPRSKAGFSFPANGGWRLWALSRYGRADAVVRDLRERWATMVSLTENGTFSEDWEPRRNSVWCQNGPVILYVLYGDILGVQPTAPGFRAFDVRPQPGGLDSVAGTVHSPAGPIRVDCTRDGGRTKVSLSTPAGVEPALVTAAGARVDGLPANARREPGPVAGAVRWKLPPLEKQWHFTF